MNISKLHDVYLALGTNIGNKEENILNAIKKINERMGMVIIHSAFYITPPVGFQSDNDFINTTCLVMTDLAPLQLLDITQQIEVDMGRTTKSANQQYADRIIDIDILLYDTLILKDKKLILPHPHLHQRDFVLTPLVEIAEQYEHPVLRKTIGELYLELKSQ